MAHIAVVNDDEEFLRLMHEILGLEGHVASTHINTDGVFENIRAEKPDLVVLDIRVDRQAQGWSVCDKLTLHPETRQIPVLVCSAALSELRDRKEWLEKHGIGVLPKPFDLDDLYGCINGMLKSGEPCMVGLEQAS